MNNADSAAFARLVGLHQAYVFRLALSVLGPGYEGDAEDVAQDVFIRVAGHLHEFRGESRFRTWLHRLTLNLAVDRRRRPRWRQPHLDPAVLDRCPTTDRGDDPFLTAEAAERTRAMHGCLDTLPDSLRRVIHLRYWMDLQVDDIAATLHIPLGTVKSHLHRGRNLLFRAMQARGLTPEGLRRCRTPDRAVTVATAPAASPARHRRAGGPACAASEARAAW